MIGNEREREKEREGNKKAKAIGEKEGRKE